MNICSLTKDLTVRLLRGVAVAHVALVEETAIRVPREDFSHLFPGESLEGLVPVEGVTSLVLREVVTGLMPEEVVACVVAEEGSVGLATVEDLARLRLGKLAVRLAPGEPPEEGIAGLGSTITAHARGSVCESRVDGKR